MDFTIGFEQITNGVRVTVVANDGTIIDMMSADNNQDILDYVSEIVCEHCIPLNA